MCTAIRLSEIPSYLHDSSLYKEFQDEKDKDDILYIPELNMKLKDDFNNSAELHHLLSTFRYWGMKRISIDIFDIMKAEEEEYKQVIEEFHTEYLYMSALNPPKSQNQQILYNAMKIGCLEIVKYLYKRKNITFDSNSCIYAASHGHLHCLQYAILNNAEINEKVLVSAASDGHLHCLQYLLQQGYIATNNIAIAAAKNGYIRILEYLQEQGLQFTKLVSIVAAENSHLTCLIYIHKHGGSIDQQVGNISAYVGSKECLTYTLQHGAILSTSLMTSAVRGGHLSMVKYLHSCHCPGNETACAEAARYGHIDILQYLHEYRYPWHASTCLNAAYTGQLSCLQYAYEHKCIWDVRTAMNAAVEGHYDCLLYAIQNRCAINIIIVRICEKHKLFYILLQIVRINSSWNELIYEIFLKDKYLEGLIYMYEYTYYKCYKIGIFAAEIGNIDILNSIKRNQYYINYTEIALISIQYNQFECLKWSFRPSISKKIKLQYVIEASMYGNISILQYLIQEKCCEYNRKVINNLIEYNYYICLEYIYEYNKVNEKNIVLWNVSTCILAASKGHLKCLQFLFEHGCPKDSRVYDAAILSNSEECIQYCLDNDCTQYTPIVEVVDDQIENDEHICACCLS